MEDPFDLARFVQAQDPVIETVLAELKQGRKQTHWMWFVFPQVAGLGRSPTAEFFAIVLCAATAVTLGMSVMSAIAPTEVHAVTQSGDEFPVPEVAAGRREQLLAMPGATKALEVLP